MSIDAIYVYIDSYIIYIELGIVYIEILVFPDVIDESRHKAGALGPKL